MSGECGFRSLVIPVITSLTASSAVFATVSSFSISLPFAFRWKSSIATFDKIEPDSATAAFPFANSMTLILFVPSCLAAPFVVWLSAANTIASLQTMPRIRVIRVFRLGFGQPKRFTAGEPSILLPKFACKQRKYKRPLKREKKQIIFRAGGPHGWKPRSLAGKMPAATAGTNFTRNPSHSYRRCRRACCGFWSWIC